MALAWGWYKFFDFYLRVSDQNMRGKMLIGKGQQDGIVGASELPNLIYGRRTSSKNLLFVKLRQILKVYYSFYGIKGSMRSDGFDIAIFWRLEVTQDSSLSIIASFNQDTLPTSLQITK